MTTDVRYLEAARSRKAQAIIAELERHAETAAGRPLQPLEPADAALVLALAEQATPQLWDDLADLAGVRRPSADTVASILRRLRTRASEPADPFKGL